MTYKIKTTSAGALKLTENESAALYNGSRELTDPKVCFIDQKRIDEIRTIAENKGILAKLTYEELTSLDIEANHQRITRNQYGVIELEGRHLIIFDTQGYTYPKYNSLMVGV